MAVDAGRWRAMFATILRSLVDVLQTYTELQAYTEWSAYSAAAGAAAA